MTETPESIPYEKPAPSRRDRLKPVELLVFSGVLGVFAGLIVLMATRSLVLAGTAVGIGFIVSVLFVALLGLGGKPSEEDVEARKDLQKKPGSDFH